MFRCQLLALIALLCTADATHADPGLLASASSGAIYTYAQEMQYAAQRAPEAESKKAWGEAATYWKLFLSKAPAHEFAPAAKCRLAVAVAMSEGKEKAAELFQQAFATANEKLSPADVVSLAQGLALNRESADRLLPLLERYVGSPLLHDPAEFRFWHGRLLQVQEKFAEAIAQFQVVCERHAADSLAPRARLRWAECLAGERKYQAAAKMASAVLDATTPADDLAFANAARQFASYCWLSAGEPVRAREILAIDDFAAASVPAQQCYLQARLREAELLFEQKQWEAAAVAFADVAEHGEQPFGESAWHHLGLCAFQRKDWPAALASFDRQRELAPAGELLTAADLVSGQVYIRQRNFSAAQAQFDVAVARSRSAGGEPVLVWLRAAEEWERVGQWRLAQNACDELLSANSASEEQSTKALECLARIAARTNDYAQALQHRRTLLSSAAGASAERLRFEIGQCHAGLKDWKRAASVFQQLAEEGESAEWCGAALFELANCFRSQQDTLLPAKQLQQLKDAELDALFELSTRFPRHEKERVARQRLEAAKPQ